MLCKVGFELGKCFYELQIFDVKKHKTLKNYNIFFVFIYIYLSI